MIESKPLPLVQPVVPFGDRAPALKHRFAVLRSQHPFFLRLLAGSLAVSIPVMLGLSIGLTYLSSQRIVAAASSATGDNAGNAALRLSDWYGERQRELAQVVSGLRRPTTGRVVLAGRDVTGRGARHMALAGVAHIPEDRLGEGLVGNLPLQDNALLKSYYKAPIARGPFLRLAAALEFTRGLIQRFGIAGATPRSTTRLLSGGQLQRFVLAREMAANPRVVVAVHPTRGLDVAATAAVQEWLVTSRDDGCAILLISEDLDEVLQLSDRVAVIYEGQILAVLKSGEASREQIGLMMVGSSSKIPSPAAAGEG